MTAALITFNCPQCGRKFSAPAAAAGKNISCGCGSQVTVPTSNSTVTTPQPTLPNVARTNPVGNVVAQPTIKSANRREFPSLGKVARVLEFLSYLYILGGILAGLFLLGAGVQNGPGGMPGAIAALLAIAVVILLAFIFIQAAAELIRLALYIAELLEDIRAK
jgi:hypothetical protein